MEKNSFFIHHEIGPCRYTNLSYENYDMLEMVLRSLQNHSIEAVHRAKGSEVREKATEFHVMDIRVANDNIPTFKSRKLDGREE